MAGMIASLPSPPARAAAKAGGLAYGQLAEANTDAVGGQVGERKAAAAAGVVDLLVEADGVGQRLAGPGGQRRGDRGVLGEIVAALQVEDQRPGLSLDRRHQQGDVLAGELGGDDEEGVPVSGGAPVRAAARRPRGGEPRTSASSALAAAFRQPVHHVRQALVGGGEALLFGRGEDQRAGRGEGAGCQV